MKFNVNYLGVNQDVDLGWLSGIANVVELMRITALGVGESVTVRQSFHVTRLS